MKRSAMFFLAGTLALFAAPAQASFHVMQVEQIIGGVNGQTTYQAIQLRMRGVGQNQMQFSRINVRDAAGLNPVLIVDMTAAVAAAATGSRVLIASPDFAAHEGPPANFIMANLIPTSYLQAGSLTFEDDFGTIYWRVSWGGALYTGTGAGDFTNDADGNFNPPIVTALPIMSLDALRFPGAATAPSTNNVADYALTVGGASFTNNAGVSAAVVPAAGVGNPSQVGIALGRPSPNPATGGLSYSVSLPRETNVRVQVLDLAGRVVRTLVDGTMAAGHTTRSWDPADGGTRVASGVYVMRLEADGVTQTRRFALMR